MSAVTIARGDALAVLALAIAVNERAAMELRRQRAVHTPE
jgi:hypothetical protein